MGSIFIQAMNLLASLVWATGTAVARRLSKKRARLPVRVISVGNIQVGGAGKTPLVAHLARQAQERGLKVCILCRGYGATWESSGGVIAPGETRADARECGDEAALLHDLAPQAWIGVGADRARQFEAVSTALLDRGVAPIELVILDDGFQNHRLHKDIEIVALTSARWGQKIFRDFRSALRSADLLVWTKGETHPQEFERPFARARMELPRTTRSERFLLVTGLADGIYARQSAERAGYRIEKHLSFPDHARYAPGVTQAIIDDARLGGLKIAVTGKDWVKWRDLVPTELKESVFEVLEPTVRLDPNDEKIWNQVIWGS